jgi:hypothetical protein
VRFVWVGLIVVLAFAGAACGGGGGEKSAASLSDADLKEMVAITSDGLPWQLTGISDTALSNEEAAQRNSDPQTWLKNYEEWGRIGGHSEAFSASSGEGTEVINVQTNVAAYESADGAGKALVGTTDYLVSDEALRRMEEAGLSDAKIEELNAAMVGDESKAYRMAATTTTADGQSEVWETIVVVWRHAEVVLTATVGAKAGGVRIEDAVAVATQMDGRVEDVLGR